METETRAKLYIGIDLDESRALISFLREGEREPVTASGGKTEKTYLFPASLFEGRGGHYLYGAEAEKRKGSTTGEFYDHLYLRACDLAETDGFGEACERLLLFIRRLIRLRENFYQKEKFEQHLVITVPVMTDACVKVMGALREGLGNEVHSLQCMDYSESFFYYTFHREPSVWQHDTALFDFSDTGVRFTLLARDMHTVPQTVVSGSRTWTLTEQASLNRDAYFSALLKEAFAKRIISGVFLLGEGFDGDWLADSQSVRLMAQNRRVFVGKNLYTKGAAYAALELCAQDPWPYVYDCGYKLPAGVRLAVTDGGKETYVTLAGAGENWFDAGNCLDVILRGSGEIAFLVQRRGEKRARIVRMLLEDVWNREEITRKIRIEAVCPDAKTLLITVRDLGFGDFYASTGMVWNFSIDLSE